MIGFVIEMVIGKIVGLFMSQRWYMAILYSTALLSLVAITIGGLGYLLLLWLFRSKEFGMPAMLGISAASIAFIVALWAAFTILQRRVHL